MIVVCDIVDQVKINLIIQLLSGQFFHVGIDSVKPYPEAEGDRQLRDEGELKQPSCETV